MYASGWVSDFSRRSTNATNSGALSKARETLTKFAGLADHAEGHARSEHQKNLDRPHLQVSILRSVRPLVSSMPIHAWASDRSLNLSSE